MKVYEEHSRFRVGKNVELEIIRYFSQREALSIVSATGLGGSAGTCCFIDYLARTYNILTFSPRNSGSSKGHLTIENYVSDTAKVIDYISQREGRKPYGIGHSIGGYTLAYLLGESPLVKRAVLLAPLIKMNEQIPFLFNNYFNWCVRHNKFYFFGFLPSSRYNSKDKNFVLDKQRFNFDDVVPFLRSIYESSICNRELLSPTKVFLPGGSCFRLPISLRELRNSKRTWEALGAEVESYPKLNHWFSGNRWFTGVGEPFSFCEKKRILKNIRDFFEAG